jgi:hypothetical protein
VHRADRECASFGHDQVESSGRVGGHRHREAELRDLDVVSERPADEQAELVTGTHPDHCRLVVDPDPPVDQAP